MEADDLADVMAATGADRDVTAGERLRQQHHIRFDIPVLDGKETPCPAHSGLDFVRHEQRAIALAQRSRIREKPVVGYVDALALNRLDDEGCNLPRGQRLFERRKVVERNREAVWQQRPETVTEVLVAGQRQRTVGQPVIAVVAIDDAGPASGAAREFDRSFDTFRP